MAKTSLKVKQQRKPKFSTRAYTRCKICGRPHSVSEKVRHLPYLLQRTGLQGRDSGCEEGFLVGDIKIAET